MNKSILLATLLLFSAQTLFCQDIATLYEKDKYKAIVVLAEKSDTADKFSGRDLYQIARAYLHQENPEKALVYLEKSLAAGRDSANVHFFIGVCEKEFKNYDKAMSAFEEALKRDPTDQYAWVEKGLLYYDQENKAEATKAFEKAVEQPYQYSYPYFVLLSLYYFEKDAKKIAPFYEKWEKTLAKSEIYEIGGWKIMGGFEKSIQKNPTKALEYFEKVLTKDGLNIKAYEDVMKIHTAQENWKKVDKIFEKLKTAYEDKRLNEEDLKKKAAVVDAVVFNDSIEVITVRYFKKPAEFADPIYKSYIINTTLDSTIMVILTEKSLSFSDKKKDRKADNHMLCGWRGNAHLNFGMITRNGVVEFADYKKRVWGILENKFTPVASSTMPSKKDD
jgi:tetratricopeptide (TPR) repeat protein